ncbi:unnamed protein product [Eruca vesicaria subsp. sativa]|uniref:TIR domain-containing protein n=1 Tax=Eruca vesicaria subsp. sativa TaxID=29727 RepID=A0ABC8K3L7_ERUVS|nr:unnamed protein product [Eruca vesicaria subsp. sativa]
MIFKLKSSISNKAHRSKLVEEMWKSKNRPQVFINFRGKDERQKLMPHLKHHLKDSNVNVFTDDDAIGEPSKNLFKHIRRSRIVVVIFSINYLESEWCLDELVEIKKCLETEKVDFAIPIFYKVKTSHVKKQSGKFGKKFVALQENYRNSRVRRWKKALRFVAKYVGLTYHKRSSVSELDFIKMIVERVDITLTKIASNENNDSPPETSTGESSNLTLVHHLNKMLPSSTTMESVNLERSYLQGFMFGSAWKDAINSSAQSSRNSFMTFHPANPLHYRAYNWGVDPRPFCYGLLEPKTQYESYDHWNFWKLPLPDAEEEPEELTSSVSLDFDQYPTINSTSTHDYTVSTSHAAEREDKTSCISFLCSCFNRCFSLIWGAKEDDKD